MNRFAGSALLVLALAPGLALAADNTSYDCYVYDKAIDGGQGSNSRQGNVTVDAANEVAAVQQTRKEYKNWQDANRFEVRCTEYTEE